MDSFDDFLSFEVKKEIADRYFGFRKSIEDESRLYLKNILAASHQLEDNIGHALVQLYTLLGKASLIDEFLQLTSLPERLFFDSHINTQPKKEGIFHHQNFRGFTRKGCLQNSFFDAYRRLHKHILDYCQTYKSLQEQHETICAQIDLFYRKNDIHMIFQFLRAIDGHAESSSPLAFDAGKNDMEKKLMLHPPPAVEELLPEISEIAEEKKIRKELKSFVVRICRQQPLLDLRKLRKP